MNPDYEILFQAGGFFIGRWIKEDKNWGKIFVSQLVDGGYRILAWEKK